MHENQARFSKKIRAVIALISGLSTKPFERVLVIGCGSGEEASAIADRFGCEVDAIDISDEHFVTPASNRMRLHVMDAAKLAFGDGTFDLLYSFHAIEHIEQLDQAFAEMRRVMRPGGLIFIGTPNKSRIVGYVGSATTLRNKILWNWWDWKRRLAGQWENHLGAHAGFTQAELIALLNRTFGTTQSQSQSESYYAALYPKAARLLLPLRRLGLLRFILPAVYASSHQTPAKT